jgi:hypothetical protein
MGSIPPIYYKWETGLVDNIWGKLRCEINVQMNETGLDTVPYLSGENEENHNKRTAILQTETIIWEILNMKQEW